MLGILYWLFVGGALAVDKYQNDSYDIRARDEAIRKRQLGENDAGVYTDSHGKTRDIETGELRIVWPDRYGDVWVEALHGVKLRNLTQEKKEREWREKAKRHPERIALVYDHWTRQSSRLRGDGLGDIIVGPVFKCLRTGELYLGRRISWDPDTMKNAYQSASSYKNAVCAAFYMRVSDGTLACLKDDWEKEQDFMLPLATPEQVDAFISAFNQKQKEGGWIKENYLLFGSTPSVQEFYLAVGGHDRIFKLDP